MKIEQENVIEFNRGYNEGFDDGFRLFSNSYEKIIEINKIIYKSEIDNTKLSQMDNTKLERILKIAILDQENEIAFNRGYNKGYTDGFHLFLKYYDNDNELNKIT